MRSTVVRALERNEPDLTDLRVLVVGLGRSGLAAIRLAMRRGARVSVTDRKAAAELGLAGEEARALGAVLHVGGHPPELAETHDLVVLSPGVAPELALLERARERGVPIWGEIELASRFCHGRVVGVTGSNGKSTVTTMIGGIFAVAGVEGGVGGNLETPFCELLERDAPEAIHVLELSSFQLETVETLRPAVAVVLNLTPDHLDRYPSFEAYGLAKARMLELQGPDDDTVLNADDPESRRFLTSVRGRLHRFSTREEVERGAWLEGPMLTLRTDHGEEELLPAAELPTPGEHNVSNALAAALAARLVGCPPEAIATGLRRYQALPHRLERVGSVGGVSFCNDSKATNPASAARAVASFDAGTIHLILGGKEKGADWSALAELIRARVRRVLLVGESSELLKSRLAGTVAMAECGTVARAVALGFRDARPGDVVLLSPGCASFDQYLNFEERGDDFRNAVRSLAAQRGVDA